eukprot:g5402.t1
MSSRFYPSAHPLSPQGIPPTRVLAGHPSRASAVDGATRSTVPGQAARLAVSRPRKAWDATNTDLSRYSLTLEERMRRKALLRSPVDTGNHRARRGRAKKKSAKGRKKVPSSAAASPGAATGPNPIRTPTRSRPALNVPSHPTKAQVHTRRAWVPSGKTAGKGLVERKPGFVDESWMVYVDGEGDQADYAGSEEDRELVDPVLKVTSPSSHSPCERVPATPAEKLPSNSTSSFRKTVGTPYSLRETSRKWNKRKEAIEAEIARAEADIFTQDAADAMRALRSTPTPGAYMGRKHTEFLKKRLVATPAATELGRRRRAEQEAALMELGAQISRLRVIRGVDDELIDPDQEQDTLNRDGNKVVGHWMHFNASNLSASLNGDLKTPYKDAHVMISSLAKIATSLASSLAESEIRLQEAEKEARDSRDALLDISTELEQVRAAREVDADTISRLVSQVPDIALQDHIQEQEEKAQGDAAGDGDDILIKVHDDEPEPASIGDEIEVEDDADAIAVAAPFDAITAKMFESENLGISGTSMRITHVHEMTCVEKGDQEAEEEPAQEPPSPVAAPRTPSAQGTVDEELTPRTAPQPAAKPNPARGIFMPSVQVNKNVNTTPLGKLDFTEYMNSAAAWRARTAEV